MITIHIHTKRSFFFVSWLTWIMIEKKNQINWNQPLTVVDSQFCSHFVFFSFCFQILKKSFFSSAIFWFFFCNFQMWINEWKKKKPVLLDDDDKSSHDGYINQPKKKEIIFLSFTIDQPIFECECVCYVRCLNFHYQGVFVFFFGFPFNIRWW